MEARLAQLLARDAGSWHQFAATNTRAAHTPVTCAASSKLKLPVSITSARSTCTNERQKEVCHTLNSFKCHTFNRLQGPLVQERQTKGGVKSH